MEATIANGNNFIGYEYRDITVSREKESLYTDAYQNFGWTLDSKAGFPIGFVSTNLKFKRDRKILNKAELTRLQRQFDACVKDIESLEQSKNSSAFIVALTVGIIGTACMAGATFSFLGGHILACIILAVPAFVGWILPYFLYNSTYAKRTQKVAPLIESKYDEIYEVCERANDLLGN